MYGIDVYVKCGCDEKYLIIVMDDIFLFLLRDYVGFYIVLLLIFIFFLIVFLYLCKNSV